MKQSEKITSASGDSETDNAAGLGSREENGTALTNKTKPGSVAALSSVPSTVTIAYAARTRASGHETRKDLPFQTLPEKLKSLYRYFKA